MKPKVQLWTDGGQDGGNPAPSGWAAILVYEGRMRTLTGYCAMATNNWAETAGVVLGLSKLKTACVVELCTDSQYVLNGVIRISRNIARIRCNADLSSHWKTNLDIWEQMLPYLREQTIVPHRVDGHKGVVMNEWCDYLAKRAAVHKLQVDEYVATVPEALLRKEERAKERAKKQPARLSR